jgi:hypothetical protein
MPTNFYFQSGNTSGTTNEQRLLEDLVIESMKIYGHVVYYLPRTVGNKDEILYEDALSYFTQAYPLEMYLENTEGFEGEGELLTKFGFEFRSTATFVVARRRWEESVGRNAENLQLPERPAEGDLLFFPKTKTFFQINYVDFLNPFYQLGKIYTYRMSCQVFEFSSETIDTGLEEIDSITDGKTQDNLGWQLIMQSGDYVLSSTSDSIILQESGTANVDPLDQTNEFEAQAADFVDFTAFNPFGEVQVRTAA